MPTGTPMDSMIIVQSGIIKWLTMSYPISCVCGFFFCIRPGNNLCSAERSEKEHIDKKRRQ